MANEEMMVYRTSRQERVFHNAKANEVLPKLFDIFDYKRTLIISSGTLTVLVIVLSV